MKIKRSLILAGMPALLLGACSENAWNDHLDGFTVPPVDASVVTAEYHLTPADYATIAGLAANKAIAENDGESEELAAIGKNGTFATEEQAQKYLPALLASTDKGLAYYTWDNGSAIKVTYNVSSQTPDLVKGINASTAEYTVSEEDYQMAWGSEEDYVDAFAPGTPASGFLPTILKNGLPDATEGQYAVVTYNNATTNPVFGNSEESWNAIEEAEVGKNLKFKGIVTAVCAQGFILTDETGSILCYEGKSFDASTVPMFSVVETGGIISSYNNGLQMPISTGTYTIVDQAEYTYPAAKVVTGADMDAAVTRTTDELAELVTFNATASVSGNYYNLNVAGASTAIGSVYQITDAMKALIEDGKEYTFTGYFISVSGKGTYYNVCLTDVQPATRAMRAPLAEVVAEPVNVLYKYNGSAWAEVTDVVTLNPSDYTEMGLTYGNFSNSQPDEYLPKWLKMKYPFAAEEDVKTVAYKYYADGKTSYTAREFILTAGEWVANVGSATTQFVKMDNVWKFNPSVTVTLPYLRNTDPTYTYFMQAVDWVYKNICEPMGDTSLTSGKYFIDYRGNAEFYSGCSAYYGNVDIRAASALEHVPAGYTGYDGLSNDEITLLMKKRFCTEVMPGVLSVLHADLAPIDGMDITLTMTFTAYDGAAKEVTAVWNVTAPGTFEYASSTWVEPGQDADWK